jgi:hypothetical protein
VLAMFNDSVCSILLYSELTTKDCEEQYTYINNCTFNARYVCRSLN